MRELHGWLGEHGRHVRDAPAPADAHVRHPPDSPKHAAQDALKRRMVTDPAFRVAEQLRYRKAVEAYEARDTAGQRKSNDARTEQATPEALDKPASDIAGRWEPVESQREKRPRPERSRLPTNETAQMMAGIGVALSSVADAINVLPGRWDAVGASFLGAAVAGVAWANKRWKDRNGNRPED